METDNNNFTTVANSISDHVRQDSFPGSRQNSEEFASGKIKNRVKEK